MFARRGMGRAAGVAVAGIGLIVIALLFDTGPLFVPGVAFTGLGVLTPLWVGAAARGARAHRRLRGDRVMEGQRFETTIDVRRGLLGLPRGEVFDPVTRSSVPVGATLSVRSGNRRATVTIVASFPRRGRKLLSPPAVISRDVLGLAEVVQAAEAEPDEVLVLPRVAAIDWIGRNIGAYSQASAGRASAEPMAAAEFDGLRPYRVGTPASRIHWPAVARGAGLLERRMRADASTQPLVVLDARCSQRVCEDLDAAVRAAASIVVEFAKRGGCGLLMPGERRPIEIDANLTRWPAAHTRLALLEGGPDQRAPALALGARTGRIFYVAAEAPRRMPQALAGHGQLAPVLVLPTTSDARARDVPAFEVAGCRGYVVGAARGASRRERVA
jgi:uncharacterized protein (DUF58 family)